jgi:hypothetical protein
MWRPGLTPDEERYVARVARLLVDDGRSVIAPVPSDCLGEWVIALEERIASSSEAVVCNLELDAHAATADFARTVARAMSSTGGDDGVLGQARTVPVIVLLRGGRVSFKELERLVVGAAQWLTPWRAGLEDGSGVRVLLEVTTSDRMARTLPEPLETVEYAISSIDSLEADVAEEVERIIRFQASAAVEFAALRILDLSGDRPRDLEILMTTFAELDPAAQRELLEQGWASAACAPPVERRRAEIAELLGPGPQLDALNLTKQQISALASSGGLCELDGCPLPTPRTFQALGRAHGAVGRDRVAERALVRCFQLERRLRAVVERERSTPRGAARLESVLASRWNARTEATVRDEIRSSAPAALAMRGEVEVATFGQLLRIAEGMVEIPPELHRNLHASLRLRNELAHQRGVDLATFGWLHTSDARAKREIGELRPRAAR